MFQSGISIASLIISIATFIIAFGVQLYYFFGNRKKLDTVRNFFVKKREYEVYGEAEDSQLNPDVAEEGSSLHTLIKELNEYTKKNHGTTDFSVIQNKTDRKINVLYDNATSRIAFPTYVGLMGTFIGVFLGLLFFTIGLGSSPNGEGITDETIGNLISGVLVSMSTSFIGLLLTTITHHLAAETQKEVREDKNEFYEFIQNELMPTLGVSMVAALNKLHHTINLFEPSFNNVIDRFQATFDSCTQRFGSAFEQNVTIVSEAVRVMGENMDKSMRMLTCKLNFSRLSALAVSLNLLMLLFALRRTLTSLQQLLIVLKLLATLSRTLPLNLSTRNAVITNLLKFHLMLPISSIRYSRALLTLRKALMLLVAASKKLTFLVTPKLKPSNKRLLLLRKSRKSLSRLWRFPTDILKIFSRCNPKLSLNSVVLTKRVSPPMPRSSRIFSMVSKKKCLDADARLWPLSRRSSLLTRFNKNSLSLAS